MLPILLFKRPNHSLNSLSRTPVSPVEYLCLQIQTYLHLLYVRSSDDCICSLQRAHLYNLSSSFILDGAYQVYWVCSKWKGSTKASPPWLDYVRLWAATAKQIYEQLYTSTPRYRRQPGACLPQHPHISRRFLSVFRICADRLFSLQSSKRPLNRQRSWSS